MGISFLCRLGALLYLGFTFPFTSLYGQASVKLLPSAGSDFDYFGEALSLDGDYAVVGSWLDDNENGTDAGSARVFHRVGAEWVEQAVLLASDGEAGDQFGISVSVNGAAVFVGAHRDDNANGPFAGAVYIFERSGETWNEREKLIAGDGAFEDHFGAAVASTGSRLIVGAPGFDQQRGAVYIYHQTGGDWLFVNRVSAMDGMPGDAFGQAADISADYAIVGTRTSDVNGISDAGAAYVLTLSVQSWIEQSRLISASPVLGGSFGQSVSIGNGLVFVGAPGEIVDDLEEAGAAYIFEQAGSVWNQQAKLTALEPEAGDAFGYAVVLGNNYAISGARWDRNNQGEKSGAAHLFEQEGDDWIQKARLIAADGEIGDQFGNAVDVSGEQVLVGARWDDNEIGKDAGAAYVFPIGGSGVPSLLTSVSQLDFGTVTIGESEERDLEIFNIGTSDLNVLQFSFEGSAASSFRFVQGGNGAVLAPQASIGATIAFTPNSAGDKAATLRIESNGPTSPHFVALSGAGAAGFQPGIVKVIASRGDVESYFGSTVSVEGDYAIVGAEGQRDTEPGAAYIYKRSGSTWVQQIRITPLDGEAGDRFGSAVDISSTHAIVGAWNDDEARGAAYVFVKSGSAWIQQARLTASDREPDDRFGQSVSIEGEHAIVGAWQDDNLRGAAAGAAYVYKLDGGSWQQQFKLLASDGRQGDRFGSAVTVEGSDVIVGAANGGFFGEGTAYVFSRDGVVWQEQGRLSASDAGLSDGFGSTVAIDGNIAVVGAPIKDDQSSIDEGAVYVFERVDGTWLERIRLSASDGASGYEFGGAVDIVGNEIVIGAGGADNQSGAIYIFSRSGNAWFETNILTPGDGENGDAFGSALGFTGSDIIVGAPEDGNVNGANAGSVYLFSRVGSSWSQQSQLLAYSRLVQPGFGASTAIDGDYAVIGAEGDAQTHGAAYVYSRVGENWTQAAELSVSDKAPGDGFGHSVSISGNYIVAGAPGDDNERGTDAGAAYVFLRGSQAWSEQARLVAFDGQSGDAFGAAVSIDGDYIAVGSPNDDNANGADAGAVYIFQRNGAGWDYLAKALASDGAGGDHLGTGLAIQQTTIAAGAPDEGPLQSGTLYVFERNGVNWNEKAKLAALEPEAGESLGGSVDIDGDYIIAGAQNRLSSSGAAFVFHRMNGGWGETEEHVIVPAGGAEGDAFGSSVSMSGGLALVGGSGVDGGRGAAYLFERDGTNWLEQTRIDPVDEGGEDAFGIAVALQDEYAVIGARDDENGNGSDAGAAYLVSLTGSIAVVSTEEENPTEEGVFLEQNYPNPFRGGTTIPYRLSGPQYVRLTVFDLLGRRVATLVDGLQPAGRYEVRFEPAGLAGGVYFYRLEADDVRLIGQFVLIDL